LGSRNLLNLWSQVRVLWLLIWWPLKTYMVVNFRACEISWGVHKLARTPTLKKNISWNELITWKRKLRLTNLAITAILTSSGLSCIQCLLPEHQLHLNKRAHAAFARFSFSQTLFFTFVTASLLFLLRYDHNQNHNSKKIKI
jgi:hypothetical protein